MRVAQLTSPPRMMISCDEKDQMPETKRSAPQLQPHLQSPDNCERLPNSDRCQLEPTQIKKRLARPLTLHVTFLVHHRFIASAHPNLPVFFIDPGHSPCLFFVLPISNQ